MIESTELAMQLAEIKLSVRKLTDKHKGVSRGFDASVNRAISGLNAAIVSSIEAVPNPNGTYRRKPTTARADEIRHSRWLEKNHISTSRLRGSGGAL